MTTFQLEKEKGEMPIGVLRNGSQVDVEGARRGVSESKR